MLDFLAARIPFDEDDLAGFLTGLRDAGFAVGAEQLMAANVLLVRLARADLLPANPRNLSSSIGPLICRSAKQQQEFRRRFDVWIGRIERRKQGATVIVLPPIEPTPTQPEQESLTKQIDEFRRGLILIRATIAMAIAVITVAASLLVPHEWRIHLRIHDRAESQGQGPAQQRPADNNPAPTETQRPPPRIAPKPNPGSKPAPGPNRPPLPTLPLWGFVIAALIVAGLIGSNYLAQRRFLSRWADDDEPTPNLDSVSIADASATKWLPHLDRDIVVRMRRREVSEDETLDIGATVTATCANAGRFTGVFELRSRVPEYLVLIERASPEDIRALRATEIVNRLQTQGIFARVFYFEGDPRIASTAEPSAVPLTTTELAMRYPDHRLIICSEGNSLVSSFTGLAHPWASMFARWEHRSLLTLVPMADWGFRERALSSAGFRVLPCTPDGFAATADVRLAARLAADAKAALPPLYPAELADEQEWLYENRPADEVVDRGMQQTREYLGQTGFEWLAACAVYPEIKVGLTLHLGEQIARPYEASILERLARLPFMRYAFMSDWVRKALLDRLSPDRARTVRAWIQVLLLSRGDSNRQMLFQIAESRPNELSRLWRAQSERWAKKAGEPIADRVFLSWMDDRLAVRAPREFLRRLHPAVESSNEVNSETLLPDTEHHWRPQTAMSFRGWFAVGMGLAGAVVLGFVYNAILTIAGVNFFAIPALATFAAGIGAVAILSSNVISKGRIRGSGLGAAVGVGCALTFVFITWLERTEYAAQHEQGVLAAVAALWAFAGVDTSQRVARVALWLVESGMIAVIGAIVAATRAAHPFCRRCQSWTASKDRVYGPFADDGMAQTDLLFGRYTRLFALSRVSPDRVRGTMVKIEHCGPECLATTLMTVVSRALHRNDIGEVTGSTANSLVQRLFVPRVIARAVFEWVTATSSIRPNLAAGADPLLRSIVDALLPFELANEGLHVFGELPPAVAAKARAKLRTPRGMPIAGVAVYDVTLWFVEFYRAYAFTENGIYAYYRGTRFTQYSELIEVLTLPDGRAIELLKKRRIEVLGPADLVVVRAVLAAVERWMKSR